MCKEGNMTQHNTPNKSCNLICLQTHKKRAQEKHEWIIIASKDFAKQKFGKKF